MKKCLYHVLYTNTISAFTTSKKEKYEKLPEMDNIAEPNPQIIWAKWRISTKFLWKVYLVIIHKKSRLHLLSIKQNFEKAQRGGVGNIYLIQPFYIKVADKMFLVKPHKLRKNPRIIFAHVALFQGTFLKKEKKMKINHIL